MTPENIRFHAAGHLAAAAALVEAGMADAAKKVLGIVQQFVAHETVSAPPQLKALLDDCANAPALMLGGIKKLEEWFVDPFNTKIEASGAQF